MGLFSGKAKHLSSPLWDFLVQYDARAVAERLEGESKTAESSEHFLQQVIMGCTFACAADFLRNTGKSVRDGLKHANADVIAFEALAFSIFCIRQYHLPPADYDDEPEALVDAYREVIAICGWQIEKVTGWSIREVWNARITQHFQLGGIKQPIERFIGMLLSIGGHETPPLRYSTPSLDPMLTAKITIEAQAFALNIPVGSVDAIQNVISEFNLID